MNRGEPALLKRFKARESGLFLAHPTLAGNKRQESDRSIPEVHAPVSVTKSGHLSDPMTGTGFGKPS